MPPKAEQKQGQAQQQVVKVQIGELPKKQARKRRPTKKRQPRIVGRPTIPPIVLPPQPQYTQLFPTFTPTIPQFTSMMPPTVGGVPVSAPIPTRPIIPATEPIAVQVPVPKKKISILKKVGKAVIKGLEVAGQQPLQKEGTTSREIQVEPMVREAEVQAVPMTRVSGIQVGEPTPIVEMPPSPRPPPRRPMEITPIEEYGGGVPQGPVQMPSKTKMKEIIDKHKTDISAIGRGELSRVRKMNQADMYNYLKGYGYL